MSERKNLTNEPIHTQGHSTKVTQTQNQEFMCPECGKTFDLKDDADEHLHSKHMEHLRSVHGEFQNRDM